MRIICRTQLDCVPPGDIWSRLTTWKFPLLQLVSVFPRPPLNFRTEFFVLSHLMGDPISTISNLLLKIASCQSRASFWKDRFTEASYRGLIVDGHGNDQQAEIALVWKSLAAIIDSYDEWGQTAGNRALEFIRRTLQVEVPNSRNAANTLNRISPTLSLEDRRRFLEICKLTGNALAADRSTKFLPIAVAEGFFIGSVAVAYGRTRQSAALANPQTFINIEAFSVAFSALYFWIIPAVFLASVVGVSQTEKAISRILDRFKQDLEKEFKNMTVDLPDEVGSRFSTEVREREGGIYSWLPVETQESIKQNSYTPQCHSIEPSTGWQRVKDICSKAVAIHHGSLTLPLFAVTYSAFTGILISYLVPPLGFECRHIGEILIYSTWIISALLNFIPFGPQQHTFRFNFILIKDIIATLATLTGIIVTQIGVFNRCSCYTRWGRVGVALPQWKSVSGVLSWRIHTAYPAISFLCIGIMLLIVPLMTARQYELAIRVFLQRDDGVSNLEWFDSVVRLPENIGRLGKWFCRMMGRLRVKVKKLYLRVLWGPQFDYDLAAVQPRG
ncbi:hypothetical protein DL98DRAFT_651609 [Cadophora sp. DSE1049]|nr:hypothetical protein DL98DRAFT_651609 [Cadophora sp. DSE1049]